MRRNVSIIRKLSLATSWLLVICIISTWNAYACRVAYDPLLYVLRNKTIFVGEVIEIEAIEPRAILRDSPSALFPMNKAEIYVWEVIRNETDAPIGSGRSLSLVYVLAYEAYDPESDSNIGLSLEPLELKPKQYGIFAVSRQGHEWHPGAFTYQSIERQAEILEMMGASQDTAWFYGELRKLSPRPVIDP